MDNDKDKSIDFIIEQFQKEKMEINKDKLKEDLRVNFEISYGDGEDYSYTCGSESNIFELKDNGCIESKIEPEEMKCYFESEEEVSIKDEVEKEYEKLDVEYEEDKWDNCEDEWKERIYENNFDEEEPRYGKIKVYSSLNEIEGVRIKGLKVNLYKINGISPELIQSEYTDCNGKVEFSKVPFGNYRVIQIIDKNYFNKPIYINWNEVLLDECNKNDTIYVVNTVKNMRN